MESIVNDAINLMTEGCFFGSIDLKDTYFSVNIREESITFSGLGSTTFCTNSLVCHRGINIHPGFLLRLCY